ncbi:hypothetical protein GH714_015696 [Hevea brasiliensis]|uniref:ENTH domain-containing protein n=1 Tax=Hevea brasiliensis TaxID=3981 RepID=A0A6A6MDS4_HEVBR|nr:hypothetical protein GH714_015696 [Hevea brasiliensis]
MATSTIRKAIGAVKDQTSISIAKVAGNIAPDLEVLVVKVTSHDEDPADERRLSKTHDWIVAIKALMLVHRLLVDGHPSFEEEIVYATRRGMRVLNMSDFRDEAHSHSWDHAAFVRFYAMYLDEKVEFAFSEQKLKAIERKFDEGYDGFGPREHRDDFDYGMPKRSRAYGDLNGDSVGKEQRREASPIRQLRPERVLGKLNQFEDA